MRKLAVLSFFIIFSSIEVIDAQTIDSLVALYHKRFPQEKIHVHFDNCLYAPGQTVWYKAYLIKDLVPSDLSKTLYIDWVDEEGKLLSRSVTPIANSIATGDFTIPQKYTGTRIQVMAYTKWMLNFDSSFLFHHTLRVAQTAGSSQNQGAIKSETILSFFPEGGDMVANIRGYVAFKALNSAGLPIEVSGTISNKNKQVVAQFNSEHSGMGKLLLTPLPGEIYTAEWKDPQGNTRYTNLPTVTNSGVAITVRNEPSVHQFIIERQPILEDRYKKITIVGSMNQQIVFKLAANLTERTKITAGLPIADLPSGILQLTLFDDNMQPIVERIVFVNNKEDRLPVQILTDTLSLEKRGKNVYQIELGDAIPATLSLSVTEGEGIYDSSQNILSQLLLSSEIKGHIHNPAYYFGSRDDSTTRHLDLVMLTNGWRRFAWTDVFAKKIPKLTYTPDTGYLSITGKIDNLSATKIKKAQLMNLVAVGKDGSQRFLFTPIQEDGSFREDNLVLFDTTKIYYKLNDVAIPARSQVKINHTFLSVDTNARGSVLANYLPDTTGIARIKAIADEQKKLDSLMRLTTLKEVVVTARIKPRIEELDEKYTHGLFSGNPNAHNFNVVDDATGGYSASVFSYLQAKVPGMQISNATDVNPRITWRGSNTFGGQIAFYLNETPVDAATLVSLSMNDVAYIKVFPPPFMGPSTGGTGGGIAVYTKKGTDIKSMASDISYTLLTGYTPFKEFYSPNYAEKQMNSSQPDLRRTLYWKPNILADGTNKKIAISFYNNDISQSLQLVMEGVAADGRLIHFSKLLK